ncbi:MAG: amidohydrolase family protein [Isosphaeraceae bacterium]
MIDVHIHVSPSGLTTPVPEGEEDFRSPPDVIAESVRGQMRDARVDQALAMGRWNAPADDPLGINGVLRVAALVKKLHAVGAADPTRTDKEHLRRADADLKAGKAVALKVYLGYLPYGPDDPGYRPYYELAMQHDIPVIFHTGDTFSTTARLKYARPLAIDDVAVDHPRMKIVMAHFGNPWLLETAEIVYKNRNVWADLSGLIVADSESLRDEEKRAGIEDVIVRVSQAIRFTERYDRILFGSDWPLVPMAAYRDIVRRMVPGQHHDRVFRENARDLFDL